MGREQMRNLEIARIGATQVNEFEYQKQHGEMTEQEHPGQQGEGGKRLTQAERVAQITAAAHKKVEKRRKKEGGSVKAAKSGSTKAGDSKKAKSATASTSKSGASKKSAKPAPAKKSGKAKKKK